MDRMAVLLSETFLCCLLAAVCLIRPTLLLSARLIVKNDHAAVDGINHNVITQVFMIQAAHDVVAFVKETFVPDLQSGRVHHLHDIQIYLEDKIVPDLFSTAFFYLLFQNSLIYLRH